MTFSAMLLHAFHDCNADLRIVCRFNGQLFNLKLQAKSEVQTDVLDKLLYADDLAENAKTETKMQGSVDRMSQTCANFHLAISTTNTASTWKVVQQQTANQPLL